MLRKSILLNSGAWCIKLLIAALISVLLLLGADGVPFDSGNATADFFEWDAEDQKDGVYGYLRQQPAFLEKNGDGFAFYATKSIWVFGEGQAMLIDWVSQDTIGRKFKIRFSYFDKSDVDAITAATTKAAKDALINQKTAGALTQTTVAVFDGQAGLYDKPSEFNHWLPEIIMDTSDTPAFQVLLDAKYPSDQDKIDEALALTDDLALDAQIYPAVGTYANDTRLAIYLPGYQPGVPVINNNTKEGWNSTISMGKDPEIWMNAQGLTYADMANENRRWGVIVGWNSHLDYDGKQTASLDVAEDESDHSNYLGLLTPVGQADPGLVKRAMAILDTTWTGVPLTGDRNLVSHSTGYYLAMDMLHYMNTMWPTPSKTRYFGISPNIRGSTLIGGNIGAQAYDSRDDMYRDNWHWNDGYRLNENTRAILNYRSMTDVEGHVMFAYGDMTSAGVGGSNVTIAGDAGVVDYTNYQPHFGSGSTFENLDDNEYGRLKRFSPYESLYNARNDGGSLDKSTTLAEWENGGDAFLRNFRADTIMSVFGENVNLGNQEADDSENYTSDHSDLAQRMMVMRLVVNGQNVDYLPAPGVPTKVVPSDESLES